MWDMLIKHIYFDSEFHTGCCKAEINGGVEGEKGRGTPDYSKLFIEDSQTQFKQVFDSE